MTYGEGWSSPVPPPPPSGYSPYVAPRNNSLATAALLTGLGGFLCLVPAVFAIGLGIAGLVQSRESGVGRGMSIAGICLGIFWLLAAVVLIIGIVLIAPLS